MKLVFGLLHSVLNKEQHGAYLKLNTKIKLFVHIHTNNTETQSTNYFLPPLSICPLHFCPCLTYTRYTPVHPCSTIIPKPYSRSIMFHSSGDCSGASRKQSNSSPAIIFLCGGIILAPADMEVFLVLVLVSMCTTVGPMCWMVRPVLRFAHSRHCSFDVGLIKK